MRDDKMDLDRNKLREMILEVDKLELSSHEIYVHLMTIYKVYDDTWGSCLKNINMHFRSPGDKIFNKIVVQDLLNYLSINEVIPQTWFGKGNEKVDKMVFYIDILDPLFNQLTRNEIERGVENRDIDEPCDLDEQQLLDVVESQVNLCINKKQGVNKVKLISVLCPVELHEIDELILLQNDSITAKIRKWTKTERAIFASQFDIHASWRLDFKSPMEQESFLEIEYEFPQEKYDGIRDKSLLSKLFSIIDLIKWVVMILSKHPYPIREGTTIITKEDSCRLDIHRRDENLCLFMKGHNTVVTKNMTEMAKKLINNFCTTSNEFKDLWDALRFFGRACVATLERDRLIDSVIGLEKLLVFSSGESRYRFSLQGATIFSTRWEESKISMFENENGLFESKDNLVKWFRNLYDERSSSVHGGYEEDNEYANSAIYALAVIIEGIIYLQKEGLLDKNRLDNNKKVIAGAVEQYVIDKAVFRNID